MRENENTAKKEQLKEVLTEGKLYAMELSPEKKHAYPLQKYAFSLTKLVFTDSLAIRYGWEPKNLPFSCSYGEPFAMSHALQCVKGEHPSTTQRNSRLPLSSEEKYAARLKSKRNFSR